MTVSHTCGMTASVARIRGDLLHTTETEAPPTAAWNARNFLELWIWIEYCSASRENAWRFHEDALRDVLRLTDSLAKLCELTGVGNEFDAPLRRAISEVAFEKLDFFAVEGYLNIATRSSHSRCVSTFRSSGSRTTSRTMRHQILRIAGHDGRGRGVNALA
jgi:hypothetical protein